MKKSTKLTVSGIIMIGFILSGIGNSYVITGDLSKTRRLHVYPSSWADSIKNQGEGRGTKPVETNTDIVIPDSNSSVKEVPVGKPPAEEVPIGDPPMGKDSMEMLKMKELPVIKNDNSIIEAKPAIKEK